MCSTATSLVVWLATGRANTHNPIPPLLAIVGHVLSLTIKQVRSCILVSSSQDYHVVSTRIYPPQSTARCSFKMTLKIQTRNLLTEKLVHQGTLFSSAYLWRDAGPCSQWEDWTATAACWRDIPTPGPPGTPGVPGIYRHNVTLLH